MRAPGLLLASSVALAASHASAADRSPPAPPSEVTPSLDVYGHLLATPDRRIFDVRGTVLSLRAAGGDATIAEPFGPPQPMPHEIQRYLNIDALKTSLVLRPAASPVRPEK
jgi:hypothetical protein